MTSHRAAAERGSVGAVLASAVMALLLVGGTTIAVGAGWATASSRARIAADFAALAGADALIQGRPPCPVAVRVARANGAQVRRCSEDGIALQVAVEVPLRPIPGLPDRATATARAGPR